MLQASKPACDHMQAHIGRRSANAARSGPGGPVKASNNELGVPWWSCRFTGIATAVVPGAMREHSAALAAKQPSKVLPHVKLDKTMQFAARAHHHVAERVHDNLLTSPLVYLRTRIWSGERQSRI